MGKSSIKDGGYTLEQYKFKLQKLLEIRKESEEKSKIEFKNALMNKKVVEEKLHNLQSDYSKYCRVDKSCRVVELKMRYSYLNALDSMINNAEEDLKDKCRIVENKRDDLKKCQIDRKTVEILKKKGQQAFIKEQNLLEQKSNDEFALYAFIRNRERR